MSISVKLKVPVKPYNNEMPNSNKPEENVPKIKYFNPASIEKREFCLNAANTYNAKLWNSIVIYNERKSFEDNKQNIPNKLKTNKRTYSKDFKIDSYFKKSF